MCVGPVLAGHYFDALIFSEVCQVTSDLCPPTPCRSCQRDAVLTGGSCRSPSSRWRPRWPHPCRWPHPSPLTARQINGQRATPELHQVTPPSPYKHTPTIAPIHPPPPFPLSTGHHQVWPVLQESPQASCPFRGASGTTSWTPQRPSTGARPAAWCCASPARPSVDTASARAASASCSGEPGLLRANTGSPRLMLAPHG